MTLRSTVVCVGAVALALVVGGPTTANPQELIYVGGNSLFESGGAPEAPVRIPDTNDYDCKGTCSGSSGCCKK